MLNKDKISFFLKHLSVSVSIAILALILVFYIWYPAPLAKAVGVTHIFLLVLAIDVIVGPLLGLVVYKKGKKSLKFDLSIIFIIQISALSYGLYNIAQGRPVWLSFDLNRFELVQNYMTDKEEQKNAEITYQSNGWLKPKWVSVRKAINDQEQNQWMFYEFEHAISPAMRPILYQPLDGHMQRVWESKQPLTKLNQFNDKSNVEKILNTYPDANGFVPLRASEIDMVVLINTQDKAFRQIVDLRPW